MKIAKQLAFATISVLTQSLPASEVPPTSIVFGKNHGITQSPSEPKKIALGVYQYSSMYETRDFNGMNMVYLANQDTIVVKSARAVSGKDLQIQRVGANKNSAQLYLWTGHEFQLIASAKARQSKIVIPGIYITNDSKYFVLQSGTAKANLIVDADQYNLSSPLGCGSTLPVDVQLWNNTDKSIEAKSYIPRYVDAMSGVTVYEVLIEAIKILPQTSYTFSGSGHTQNGAHRIQLEIRPIDDPTWSQWSTFFINPNIGDPYADGHTADYTRTSYLTTFGTEGGSATWTGDGSHQLWVHRENDLGCDAKLFKVVYEPRK